MMGRNNNINVKCSQLNVTSEKFVEVKVKIGVGFIEFFLKSMIPFSLASGYEPMAEV